MTVNDVVLALCARTLRRYLLRVGALPDEALLASCPVSVRTEAEAGRFDNRLSVMFARLPTDVADAAASIRAASDYASAAKSEHRQLGPSLLAEWAEVADPRSLSWATDQISRFRLGDRLPAAHNVVVSNLAGPPVPLYLEAPGSSRATRWGRCSKGPA